MRLASLLPFALVLGALSAHGHKKVVEQERESDEGAPNARRMWLLKRGTVPEGAHRAAVRAFRDLPHVLDGPPPSSLQPWKPIGPAPLMESPGFLSNVKNASGRATAIAVHPQDPARAYAGFAGGGVWKTINAGLTWTSVSDSLTSLAIGAIVIDPKAPETIYVGTGEPDQSIDSFAGHGIFKSIDGGATWTQPGGTALSGVAISQIVLDADQGAIYASTVGGFQYLDDFCSNVASDLTKVGLFKSADGGTTWNQLQKGQISDFIVDTTKSPREFLLSKFSAGLLHYVEGAATAALVNNVPNGGKVSRVGIARAPGMPNVFFAAVGGQVAPLGIYRSIDGGDTWTLLPNTPNWCKDQCYYDDLITVSPADPNIVMLGGSQCGMWRSTDALSDMPTWKSPGLPGGCAADQSNWTSSSVHPDTHAIVFAPSDPTRVWAANDGGITTSVDAGASFQSHNFGIATNEFYGLCIDPANPDVVVGGMQDNGYAKRSGDVLPWTAISGGDGGNCVLDPTNPGTGLTSVQNGVVHQRSANFQFGQVVFDASPGQCAGLPGCGDRASWEVPLAMDPTTPANVYVGTHRVWRSPSGGKFGSWTAISPDVTAGKAGVKCANGGAISDTLSAIAVAPSAGTTIYAGSASGIVQVTGDDGSSWTNLSQSPLPRRWVSGIAIDPTNEKVVDVAFAGYSAGAAVPGHVFHSDDGGMSFVLRDIPIDVSVNALLAHPNASGLLYLATDAGVLVTTDAGKSWIPLGTGLPPAPVSALSFHAGAARLVAGTYGRSAWSMSFSPKLGMVTPISVNLTATLGQATDPTGDVAVVNDEPLGSTLDVDVSVDAPWVALDVPQLHVAGAQPKHVKVTAALAGKAVGKYDGTITVTSSNATATVPVHLTITMPTPPAMGGAGGGAGTSAASGAGGATPTGGASGASGASAAAVPPAAAPSDDSGGCGCRTATARASVASVAGASLLLLMALRRRRSARFYMSLAIATRTPVGGMVFLQLRPEDMSLHATQGGSTPGIRM